MTLVTMESGPSAITVANLGKRWSWHPRLTHTELIAQIRFSILTIIKKANHHLAVDILPES